MNLFTISDLQRYSGVNVHSIRAWEKRYNALTPHRTKGNTRYYDGEQLRRLLNIVSLMHDGHKISELCALPDTKLTKLLQDKLENKVLHSDNDEFLISQLVAASMEFDETLFNKIFNRSIEKYGLEMAYVQVIYPTIQRIGVLWSLEGISPANEHFTTHLIKQKLNTSIDQLVNQNSKKQSWLLFLPEGELHEIGLLMAHYLIRNAGIRSTYLGANIPLSTVKDAISTIKPTHVLSFLVVKDDIERDEHFVKSLAKTFPQQKIHIAADPARIQWIKSLKNIHTLTSMNDLLKQIK